MLVDHEGAQLREIEAFDTDQRLIVVPSVESVSQTHAVRQLASDSGDVASAQHLKEADAFFRDGVADFEEGHFERATARFSEAIALHPAHSGAHTGKGVSLYRRGDHAGREDLI